ncbi:hypothetical protein DVA76_18920, partial [Acinetobacter baumannii]
WHSGSWRGGGWWCIEVGGGGWGVLPRSSTYTAAHRQGEECVVWHTHTHTHTHTLTYIDTPTFSVQSVWLKWERINNKFTN